MKRAFVIILIVFATVLLGCTQGETDVSGTNQGGHVVGTIALHYQPMQCEEMPWAEYKTGTVTTEESIVIWLEKNGVFNPVVDEISNEVVCEACDVCPYYYRYVAAIDSKYESKLRELGFGESVE